MAQNITLLGASYSAVPAVTLPKTGGGTARFDDTSDASAAASDITSGKTAYVNGVKLTGTNSGGGGSSAHVTGTFTPASASAGTYETVSIPYTGSGYPIAAVIRPSAGSYCSGEAIYTVVHRYAIAEWFMTKAVNSTAPTYGTSGTQNQGATAWVYKSSSSSATSYSRSSAMNTNTYTTNHASAAGATVCRFKSGTSMEIFVANTSYGFLAGTEYRYDIIYSS